MKTSVEFPVSTCPVLPILPCSPHGEWPHQRRPQGAVGGRGPSHQQGPLPRCAGGGTMTWGREWVGWGCPAWRPWAGRGWRRLRMMKRGWWVLRWPSWNPSYASYSCCVRTTIEIYRWEATRYVLFQLFLKKQFYLPQKTGQLSVNLHEIFWHISLMSTCHYT